MSNSAQTRKPLGDVSNKVASPATSSQRKRHTDPVPAPPRSTKHQARSPFVARDNAPQVAESNKLLSFLDEFGLGPTTLGGNGSDSLSSHESFDLDKLSALLEAQLSSNPQSENRGQKERVKSLDNSIKLELIYSSSSSFSPWCSSESYSPTGVQSCSTSSTVPYSILENASLTHSGLSEEEEWNVKDSNHGSETHEWGNEPRRDVKSVRWVFPVPPPVFMTEPAISNHAAERKLQPITEETFDPPSVSPAQVKAIQRKSVQSKSLLPTAQRSSQRRISTKNFPSRPSVPSLLSFSDKTPSNDRHRMHTERYPRSRYGPMDRDRLRRLSFERLQLVRTTSVRTISPTSDISSMSQENYAVFPRAGNLIQLRQEDHTALFDDWSLSFVNLGVIKRSLYAFDLRMRSGTGLDWAEEEEIKQLIGYHQDWEYDWDKRWRVASLLFCDGDEDDAEEVF